jgi:DNA-binding CsgD family transcriptional regulator
MADLTRAIEIGTVDEPSEHHAANLLDLAGAHADGAATAEAERLVDEAERYCREHGLDRLRFRARVQRAQVMLQRGRTAEAEDLATALADDATEPGAIKTAAEAILARILVRRGDERAGELVERAWSAAVATGEIDALAFAGVTRLEHLWVEGGGEGLPQFARYLLGLGDRHGHHRLRAEARRAVQRLDGDHGRAETNRAALPGCPGPLAAALDGDHLRAARGWEAAGEPYEQALELVESTEPSAAFEGLRLLDRVGATRIADLARQRLRLRGLPGVPRGPRRAPDGGVPVLTGRQIDVLRLVARGHTNAEIAQELYVARRTVDNHVSAILSRLGVEGRGRAVAEARSRGLIEH